MYRLDLLAVRVYGARDRTVIVAGDIGDEIAGRVRHATESGTVPDDFPFGGWTASAPLYLVRREPARAVAGSSTDKTFDEAP
jgi:hypothetical protein